MRRPVVIRRVVVIAVVAWLLGLAMLVFALDRAAPGPGGQEVQGLGIGSVDGVGGIAFVSGKQLTCGPATLAPFTSRCAMELAGHTLEVHALHNSPGHPNQLGGACTAFYAGQEWPCRLGMRHLGVPWFAYVDLPLGLSPTQLEGIRRTHLLANLPERPFVIGTFAVPMLTAIFLAGGVATWLVTGGYRRTAVGGAVLTTTPAVLVGTFLLALRATRGFWD